MPLDTLYDYFHDPLPLTGEKLHYLCFKDKLVRFESHRLKIQGYLM